MKHLIPLFRLGVVLLLLVAAGCSNSPGSEESEGLANDQRDCLALSMYWEARADGREGMRAVGHVVLNRIADTRFPADACAVVFDGGEKPPCQFSWYCDGRSDRPTDSESWKTAQGLADQLLSGTLRDTTKGALFFHSARIKNPWKVERQKTKKIGGHVFYRE